MKLLNIIVKQIEKILNLETCVKITVLLLPTDLATLLQD